MNNEEVLKYIEEHQEILGEICGKFNLYFGEKRVEDIEKTYEFLLKLYKRFKERAQAPDHTEDDVTRYHNVEKQIEDWTARYQMVDSLVNKDLYGYFLPDSLDKTDLFDFIKDVAHTSNIEDDFLLDVVINSDMCKVWDEVGGQDGMYENFPIFRQYKSIEKNNTYHDTYYDEDREYEVEYIRTYGLDSEGGICILEKRTHCKGGKNINPYITSRFQLLTLGEDDAFHFLKSRNLYEDYYGSLDSFTKLLNKTIKFWKNGNKNNEGK